MKKNLNSRLLPHDERSYQKRVSLGVLLLSISTLLCGGIELIFIYDDALFWEVSKWETFACFRLACVAFAVACGAVWPELYRSIAVMRVPQQYRNGLTLAVLQILLLSASYLTAACVQGTTAPVDMIIFAIEMYFVVIVSLIIGTRFKMRWHRFIFRKLFLKKKRKVVSPMSPRALEIAHAAESVYVDRFDTKGDTSFVK